MYPIGIQGIKKQRDARSMLFSAGPPEPDDI
jgi:hypothetical protein